eukprot:NODE_13503_length_1161_cov_8.438104.p3 GENE.NODE_13503_length_1161_cov_8.438104~~NODE_13503_length_1161_cov_8.438104.p3  ORF type:complete len:151 (+),score=35.14 NODE_13503_length_1161_cov_8.438104:2-454(+)
MFASRALPRMLEVVEDDRQALRESFAVLSSFADRRFPKNAELAALKAGESPIPLLRELLRLIVTGPPHRRVREKVAAAGTLVAASTAEALAASAAPKRAARTMRSGGPSASLSRSRSRSGSLSLSRSRCRGRGRSRRSSFSGSGSTVNGR